jgi:glycosyltransferase involved in cell wall biosynthesis
MVILEAMAAGVPVVGGNIGGIPDLIEPGKTGFLCDPRSEASIRLAVQNALNQPNATRAMAAVARAQAQQRFHPRVVAERHLEIYKEVLADR